MSRFGALIVLSIIGFDSFTSFETSALEDSSQQTAYIFDIQRLGHDALASSNLKTLLESPSVSKIFFDSRKDSDALWHQFGVKLNNVIVRIIAISLACADAYQDLPVFDQGCRIFSGQEPPSRLRPRNVPFVKSLGETTARYFSAAEMLEFDVWGDSPHKIDPKVWTRRPTIRCAASLLRIGYFDHRPPLFLHASPQSSFGFETRSGHGQSKLHKVFPGHEKGRALEHRS